MTERRIFILSGGAGTRLWPLSRENFPKQFYDLAGTSKPLLIDTVERLQGLGKIAVITTEALRPATTGLLNRYGHSDVDVIGEPQARNTAAAVALATQLARADNPKSFIGIFSADHFIAAKNKFRELVTLAFAEASSRNEVVTLGLSPEYPATGYGYMELVSEIPSGNSEIKSALKVKRFVEKPSVENAIALIATKRAVWNGGMFLFPADLMARHFQTLMPKLWSSISALKSDRSNLKEIYAQVEAQSFDYGVMEKLESLYCVPGTSMGWSDVGSWEEVARTRKPDSKIVEVSGEGNYYAGFGETSKAVGFIGLTDTMVVDTPDALLVLKKGDGQKVREVVSALKAENTQNPVLKNHLFEERPWGRFEILTDNEHYKSKRITVWPGQKLSYQSHAKRSEHWVIVSGQAQVVLDSKEISLKAGEHIFIPVGSKHRIGNIGPEVLEFIEVQTGAYFGEDDIVRYSDDYGRS